MISIQEFIENRFYIDFEYYGLDTARFGENSSRTFKKFYRVISEIISKDVVGIIQKDDTVSFIDSNNKVIGISGVDKEYKERLVMGNAFIYDSGLNIYKMNPLLPTYIKNLTSSKPTNKMVINIKGIDYEFIGISNTKDSYLKKSIQTYGNQNLLIVPKKVFISYYVYVTGNNYANSFGVRGSDGSSFHVGAIDNGVFITLKTIKNTEVFKN